MLDVKFKEEVLDILKDMRTIIGEVNDNVSSINRRLDRVDLNSQEFEINRLGDKLNHLEKAIEEEAWQDAELEK